MNLDRIIQEGFESTNKMYAHFEIYKMGDERVLYDSERDEIFIQYLIPEKVIRI